MHSNFDRIRIAVGAIIALAGVGVLIFVWIDGLTNWVLAGFGILFIIVGVVIVASHKDSDLAGGIFDFINIFRNL